MSEPSAYEIQRRDYLRGELAKINPNHGQVKLQLTNETGCTKWLNITAAQLTAIEKILVPDPVTYAPCLTGRVEAAGTVSEFMIPLEDDSVGFSQWGAPTEVLWSRVELLDNLSGQAREWWADNKPEDPDA